MTKKLTRGQQLSLDLAHKLLETCAKFCDVNAVRDIGLNESHVCLVAVQSALIGLLARHPNGDAARLKLAESLVDGTAKGYIEDALNVNNKGRH